METDKEIQDQQERCGEREAEAGKDRCKQMEPRKTGKRQIGLMGADKRAQQYGKEIGKDSWSQSNEQGDMYTR